MHRLSTYVLTIVVATVMFALVAAHRSRFVATTSTNQTNAAFRDGVFLARLDVENGRNPHLMSGRWGTDADRRLFVAAYLETYHEMRSDATPEQLSSSRPAAMRGYRDGLEDGLQQRYEARPFQPAATRNYLRADRGYSDGRGNLNQYKQAYREAYCNGYQEAYYSELSRVETAKIQMRNE